MLNGICLGLSIIDVVDSELIKKHPLYIYIYSVALHLLSRLVRIQKLMNYCMLQYFYMYVSIMHA